MLSSNYDFYSLYRKKMGENIDTINPSGFVKDKNFIRKVKLKYYAGKKYKL